MPNIRSICNCVVYGIDISPYEYTNPIRPNMKSRDTVLQEIKRHEIVCEISQLLRLEILNRHIPTCPYPHTHKD